ncbi:RHS repeat-associated core domain-containing protein [Arthrobacter sp. RCC_34]|uniref:RHS repeat-associated core domain-containing protein n=1 Tax=Arthrobacter sp. RCC_34 TaxID=3239230 RepID=UPI003523B2A6
MGSNAANPAGFGAVNGYIGKLADSQSKLVQVGARELDPTLGVFTAPDPVLDKSTQRLFSPYMYSGADPVNFSDPSGLFLCDVCNGYESRPNVPINHTNGPIKDYGKKWEQAQYGTLTVAPGGPGNYYYGTSNPYWRYTGHNQPKPGYNRYGCGSLGCASTFYTPNKNFISTEMSAQEVQVMATTAVVGVSLMVCPFSGGFTCALAAGITTWIGQTVVDQVENPGHTIGQSIGAAAPGAIAAMIPIPGAGSLGAVGKTALSSGSRIGLNAAAGNGARDLIAATHLGAGIEATVKTGLGVRRLDILTSDGIAIESKLGRTSLTKEVRAQVAKDAWLLKNDENIHEVWWIFSRSGVTGKVGPTAPLERALNDAGIKIGYAP